jgi:hypothetical protein
MLQIFVLSSRTKMNIYLLLALCLNSSGIIARVPSRPVDRKPGADGNIQNAGAIN